MEVQQLRYALAVFETGSFTKAATKCFTSRQNVSYAIKSLESELGVTIFIREGNSSVPTDQGAKFLQSATSLIARLDDIQDMFEKESPEESDSRFRFAVGMNVLSGISKSLNEFFMEKADRFEITELNAEDCYKKVCTMECDAALVMSMQHDFANCLCKEIAQEKSYLLVPDSSILSLKPEVDIFDITKTNLMLMPGPSLQYHPLLTQLDSLEYERGRINIVSSVSSVVKMVKRGFGAAIVSEKYAIDVPSGTIAVPISDSRLWWHFYLLYQAGSISKSSNRQIIKELEEAF